MMWWPPYDGDNEEGVVMPTRTRLLAAGAATLLGEAAALWAPSWAIGVVSGAAIFLIAGSLRTLLNKTAADAAGEYGERRRFGQTFSASLPWKINQPRLGAAYDVAVVLAAELSDLIPQDADIAAGANRLRTIVEQAPKPSSASIPTSSTSSSRSPKRPAAASRRLCRSRPGPPNGSSTTPSTSWVAS
jgi:hypothetical protein